MSKIPTLKYDGDHRRDLPNDAEYWGSEHEERYTQTDIDDAIEEIIADWHPTPIADMPETITVCGFRPMVIRDGKPDADWLLERVLEELDEEYGDPDEATAPTEGMKRAAEYFCAAIRREYHVWSCEQVCRVEVDVRSWVARHRPDWLQEMIRCTKCGREASSSEVRDVRTGRGHEAAGEDCEWCRVPEGDYGPTAEPPTEPRARFRWAVREMANLAAQLGVSVQVEDWYSDGRAYRRAAFEVALPSDGWAVILCAVERLRRRVGAHYTVYRDGGLGFALSRDLTEEEQLVPWPSAPVPVRLSDFLGGGQ